jgi:hypothetical protein
MIRVQCFNLILSIVTFQIPTKWEDIF